jgi:general L-amino acid transport system substrate-binding protein
MRVARLVAASFICALWWDVAAAGTSLDRITERGTLKCGVVEPSIGLFVVDSNGNWVGFFVDFCRAIAAASLKSADAVEYVQLNTQTRFDALRAAEVDVMVANTTLTLSREAGAGMKFAGVYYYDGQGFMAHRANGPTTLAQQRSSTVCVTTSTTTELNLNEVRASRKLALEIVPFRSVEEMFNAFFARRCDLVTTDRIALASQRVSRAPKPADFIVLPEIVSKEPLGPVTRDDDLQWNEIVAWTLNALLTAEEKGVTAANVDDMRRSGDVEIRRLLGIEGTLGASLGLDREWAYRIIKQVGNYSEIFERNLGSRSPLGLERGLNALWSSGGLMYSPPFR